MTNDCFYTKKKAVNAKPTAQVYGRNCLNNITKTGLLANATCTSRMFVAPSFRSLLTKVCISRASMFALSVAFMAAGAFAQAAPNQPPAGAPPGSTPAGTYAPDGTPNGVVLRPQQTVALLPATGPNCNAECATYNFHIAQNPAYYGGLTRANSITDIRARLNSLLAAHPHTNPNWLAARLAQQAWRDANLPVAVNKDHSLKNISVLLHIIAPGAVLP